MSFKGGFQIWMLAGSANTGGASWLPCKAAPYITKSSNSPQPFESRIYVLTAGYKCHSTGNNSRAKVVLPLPRTPSTLHVCCKLITTCAVIRCGTTRASTAAFWRVCSISAGVACLWLLCPALSSLNLCRIFGL